MSAIIQTKLYSQGVAWIVPKMRATVKEARFNSLVGLLRNALQCTLADRLADKDQKGPS